jgi:hypothetical protein
MNWFFFLNRLYGWVWWFKPVILATQEAESGRILDQGKPGQKACEIHLNQWLCKVACTYHLSHLEETQIERSWPGHKARPHLKNNQHKKGW